MQQLPVDDRAAVCTGAAHTGSSHATRDATVPRAGAGGVRDRHAVALRPTGVGATPVGGDLRWHEPVDALVVVAGAALAQSRLHGWA